MTQHDSNPNSLQAELDKCRGNLEQARAILDTLDEGVLLVDGNGHVLFANRGMGALLNRDYRRIAGTCCCDVLQHHRATPHGCPVVNFPKGQTGFFEVFFPEYKYYKENVYRIIREGHSNCYVISISELTSLHLMTQERRQLVGQLEASQRKNRAMEETLNQLKTQTAQLESTGVTGKLLGVLYPEMCRTVNSLFEGLSLLSAETGSTESSLVDPLAVLRELLATAKRARGMVDKLSMLHMQEDHEAGFEVNNMVQSAVDEVASEALRAGVTLRFNRGDAGTLDGHRAQLREVVASLLWNALDACRSSPKLGMGVEVSTSRTAGRVLIEVKDQGRGIAPADRPRLFTPFFTTDSGGDRVGLGLVVCLHLIQAHKGSIEVDSVPGKGTSVTISLPVT